MTDQHSGTRCSKLHWAKFLSVSANVEESFVKMKDVSGKVIFAPRQDVTLKAVQVVVLR